MNKKHVFIGIGAYTGLIKESTLIMPRHAIRDLVAVAKLQYVKHIGAYRGANNKYYLEEVAILKQDDVNMESLVTKYPKEEAFYVAEIQGVTPLVTDGVSDVIKMFDALKEGEGFTLEIGEDDKLYQIDTLNGELLEVEGE